MTARAQPVAAVLAGGGSRRMGRDKALLERGGETLLARTVRIAGGAVPRVLVIGRPGPVGGAEAIADDRPGEGPLAALATALQAAHPAPVLLLPCDLPRLTPVAVAWLLGAWYGCREPLGLAATVDGAVEPLFAVYDAAAAAAAAAALAAGQRSPSRLIAAGGVGLAEVPAAHRDALVDCDEPGDWDALPR